MVPITRTWRTVLVAVAALGLAGLVSVAWAQGPGGPGGRGWRPHPGPGMGGMPGVFLPLRGAHLTEAQRTQVRTLMEQYRKTWEPQLRPALTAVANAVKATPVDEGVIRARCADLAAGTGQRGRGGRAVARAAAGPAHAGTAAAAAAVRGAEGATHAPADGAASAAQARRRAIVPRTPGRFCGGPGARFRPGRPPRTIRRLEQAPPWSSPDELDLIRRNGSVVGYNTPISRAVHVRPLR